MQGFRKKFIAGTEFQAGLIASSTKSVLPSGGIPTLVNMVSEDVTIDQLSAPSLKFQAGLLLIYPRETPVPANSSDCFI